MNFNPQNKRLDATGLMKAIKTSIENAEAKEDDAALIVGSNNFYSMSSSVGPNVDALDEKYVKAIEAFMREEDASAKKGCV